MIGEGVEHCYVACATDHRYVALTCVMLSSLDDNADIPEATLLIAAFGLSEDDQAHIRLSAGKYGERARFVHLDENSPEFIVRPPFDCPLPLLARFVLPGLLKEPRSRLIMLDTDMIVNRSLRPLFEMNMRGVPVAAVHDSISWREHYGREPHPHYFNAGMMMIDVDRFNAEEIGRRSLERLAAYDHRPMWLDQDAINDVLGDRWLPLDRRWNFFHAADYRGFTSQDYDRADIIHFAGGKPWDNPTHPGAPAFFKHAERVERKLAHQPVQGSAGLTRSFAAGCYEILLGRQLENSEPYYSRIHFSPSEFVGAVVGSEEFNKKVLRPLRDGQSLAEHDRRPPLDIRQRFWAMEFLPLLETSAKKLEDAKDWRSLLSVLVGDGRLMASANLPPLR